MHEVTSETGYVYAVQDKKKLTRAKEHSESKPTDHDMYSLPDKGKKKNTGKVSCHIQG